MSFNDDMKLRGVHAEDDIYQYAWLPTSDYDNFGTLRIYDRNAPSKPLIIEKGTLRPRGVDLHKSLIEKGMYYINKRKMKLAEDNSNLEEVIDQRIHDSFAVDAQLTEPLPWEEAWEHISPAPVEYALYWFTGYYSTSGAIVYESKELALHAEAMLKKNIAGVIVVLTPMEGRVPDDGDKE